MRRLLAPLLLVAILASFPASLLLIFIRGIIVSTAEAGGGGSGGGCDACASSCSSTITQYYYDGACGRGMAPPAYDANVMSGTSSFVGSRLFAHAITTHHHDVLLPPSRYPMVIATAASIAAATTASTTTTMTSSSPSSSGCNIGIVRSVMADSSHSRGGGSSGNNYYKPRQARSASGPGQQEPGSPLLRHQQREIAVEVRDGYEKAPKSSSSSSSSSASQHQRHSPRGAAEPPPDTLKVTVLGPLRGKSSSCTYSLVEFTNTVSVQTPLVVRASVWHTSSCIAHPE